MLQNLQDNKQEIEELAILIQKLKNEQLILSQKVQMNVQKLERQSLDTISSKNGLNNSYNLNQQQQSQSKENLTQQIETEHWSFSEHSQTKSPTKMITLNNSIQNFQNQIQNSQYYAQEHQNSTHQLADQSPYIKNMNDELFFNSKDQNKNIIQGFTLFRQDSSQQQFFNTQESNSSSHQGYEFNKMQQGFINTTNATTNTSNNDQFSPTSKFQQYYGENNPKNHLKQSRQENNNHIFIVQDIHAQNNNQVNQLEDTSKQFGTENNNDNQIASKYIQVDHESLQKEVLELKSALKDQNQQILTYQEIIKYKDEQFKKQIELEDSMKKITQGLLDQLRQTKHQLTIINQQKQEVQSLLFGLEEEYQKAISDLGQKKNQIKYILDENIQLEKNIAEIKRDYELKLEEKYSSQYNQNYLGQIDSLIQIVNSGQVKDKENNQNLLFNNIQKQLTQQLRQINESELKIQLLRKQNKRYKQKLLEHAIKKVQFIFTLKKVQFFKSLKLKCFQQSFSQN